MDSEEFNESLFTDVEALRVKKDGITFSLSTQLHVGKNTNLKIIRHVNVTASKFHPLLT